MITVAKGNVPRPAYYSEHEVSLVSSPSFVDLFSGAGGLSLGLERAGLQGIAGVDHWPDAVDTYRENLAHPAFDLPVEELRGRKLAEVFDSKPTWIVGGPPCQGYSTVGKRNRDDDRNRLFLEYRRIVKAIRPQGFVIENVLGLKDMRFEAEVAAAFEALGYSVVCMVLTAAEFGVPQLRRRVIFVGRADGSRFLGPLPTHAPDSFVTVDQAIGDLPELKPGESAIRYDKPPRSSFAKQMRARSRVLSSHAASKHPEYLVEAISHIPDGGNRSSIPTELQPSSGFHNSYSRLASWLPAVAVTQNMSKPSATRCIHPHQDRGLTAREGARLQSFPDSFTFTHGAVSQRLQIANAVPPLLGEAIGRALVDSGRWT
jgi:DNA (cytosine-5)-methyltransferase 1